MIFRTQAELKHAYAKTLQAAGRSVSIDVPVGDRGSVDILTDREIICCVLELNAQSATTVSSQLDFYGRFSPSWEKVVVVQQVSDVSAAAVLVDKNIKVINLSEDDLFEGDLFEDIREPVIEQRASPTAIQPQHLTAQLDAQLDVQSGVQAEFIYRYPKLDSVEGGDGLRAVIGAMGFVFLLGIVISLVQS